MLEQKVWHRRGAGGGGKQRLDAVEPPEVPQHTSGRTSIGLALGGGAARGWAHIGILKVLAEAGFAPDIIAGTSIGAVVGGCYAFGGLDQLEAFALDLNKRRILGFMDFNFGGSGLINGNRLAKLLQEGMGDIQLEALATRFVCIATELGTGHEIWLSKGHAVDAMRASYALPGIFRPVKVHGRWLIDGALVNPVPVSVCRAFGARLVIAVNLQADVFGRGTIVRAHDPHDSLPDLNGEEKAAETADRNAARRLLRRQLVGEPSGPPGISTVMVDAFNIVQDRIARSRLAGDPPDVMIGPRLGDIGLFDFHRARAAIDAGAEAAQRMLSDITEMVESLGP